MLYCFFKLYGKYVVYLKQISVETTEALKHCRSTKGHSQTTLKNEIGSTGNVNGIQILSHNILKEFSKPVLSTNFFNRLLFNTLEPSIFCMKL